MNKMNLFHAEIQVSIHILKDTFNFLKCKDMDFKITFFFCDLHHLDLDVNDLCRVSGNNLFLALNMTDTFKSAKNSKFNRLFSNITL